MAEEDGQSGRRPEKSRREAPAGGPGGGSPLARREAASYGYRCYPFPDSLMTLALARLKMEPATRKSSAATAAAFRAALAPAASAFAASSTRVAAACPMRTAPSSRTPELRPAAALSRCAAAMTTFVN